MTTTIGFIGGGNMASSLIGGLINSQIAAADKLFVYDPNTEQLNRLAEQFSVQTADSNADLIKQSSVVVIAVKPQVLQTVLSPLADDINQHKPLLISIVAGIESQSIEKWLGDEQAIIRVMPNTPALVNAGASGLYANKAVSDQQKQLAEQLISSVGSCCWVDKESDIDTITALSGSGPAYFMLFMQSLIESAQNAGLDHKTAKELAIATADGAAKLVAHSDLPLQTLIENVTSPGGTTEQALLSFKQANFNEIVQQAFEAARLRSESLAKELAK